MADLYGDAAVESAAIKAWRKMAVVGGLVSIALGLVLLIWPEQTLAVVAALIGVWLVIGGIIRIASAATDRDAGTGTRVLEGLVGLALIVLGIVFLAHLVTSLKVLAVLIGVIWIVAGLAEIVSSFARRMTGWQRTGAILLGVVTILGGLVLLFWPGPTLVVLTWFTGLWLILIGLVQLFLAWRARRLEPAEPGPIHPAR
jgi:uncharacterized membrane protein HdeD (DUF308 family)